MTRIGSILVLATGVGAMGLGLIFLLGAGGQLHRYIVAALGLLIGAGLVGWGIRLFRQADALTPERLRDDLLAFAREKNGEVSYGDCQAYFQHRWRHAEDELEVLIARSICRRREKEGGIYFVFPDLQPRLTMRICQFCQAELPLDDSLSTCPKCGGTIKTQVQRMSLSEGDYYGMDE